MATPPEAFLNAVCHKKHEESIASNSRFSKEKRFLALGG